MIYVKRFTLISSNDVISEELIFIRTDEESAVRLNRWKPVVNMNWIGDMTIKNFDHLSNHHSSKLAGKERYHDYYNRAVYKQAICLDFIKRSFIYFY